MIKRFLLLVAFALLSINLYGQETKRIPAPVLPYRVAQAPTAAPASSATNQVMLVALRHSIRDDHTRVVLEFNGDITYNTEFKGNVFQLTISGCRNLVPTNKTDPVGRDLEKMYINSGPNRTGLILTFHLPQNNRMPLVESIGGPFRLIISLPATETTGDSLGATTLVSTQGGAEGQRADATAGGEKEGETEQQVEPIPEINIEVPAAKLENTEFLSRTILIDAGHGGTDFGAEVPGRLKEKDINLSVAKKLGERLKELGFKVSLLRNTDVSISHDQRISLANKVGGDLFISIHTGFSLDPTKHGIGCYYFNEVGHYSDKRASGMTYDAVFNEWVKNTRFDLALFLGKKVEERLAQHLNTKTRGVMGLPFGELKFIMVPGIMVEVGMLSDSIDGKNLMSEKYHEAIASSIANGVVDFFNGIVVRTE